MPSKTQLAFERRDLTALTRIGVRKCTDLHPPVSTDAGAKHIKHAHRRYRTNRYTWIENWIAGELANPREGDTGARLMTRLRWRLIDAIRKEYADRKRCFRDPKDTRNRREKLPDRETAHSLLSTLTPPDDPVLLDLWERIVDAYPDWRLTTNRQLAVVCGVHHNVISSRRRALALLMHQDASSQQGHLLVYGLRLRVGAMRKTEIRRAEFALGMVDQKKVVTTKRPTGTVRLMAWSGRPGEGMPQLQPVFGSIEPIRHPRCPHVSEDGRQCIYSQAKCPTHAATQG
ncbi:MAG: hypothetical protein WB755_14845 [Terriglobales bacterium]